MSITLVKCMITGYEDASGIAPQELKCLLRHGSASPFRSLWTEIKQNCIRKVVAEKVLSETNFLLGEEKKKECSPKKN